MDAEHEGHQRHPMHRDQLLSTGQRSSCVKEVCREGGGGSAMRADRFAESVSRGGPEHRDGAINRSAMLSRDLGRAVSARGRTRIIYERALLHIRTRQWAVCPPRPRADRVVFPTSALSPPEFSDRVIAGELCGSMSEQDAQSGDEHNGDDGMDDDGVGQDQDEEVAADQDEDNAAEDDDDDEAAAAPETSAKGGKRKRGSKSKKGGKKAKKVKLSSDPATPQAQAIDPATASSAELCESFGLVDVAPEYGDEDFANITSAKAFLVRVKPLLQSANPKANASKLQQVMQAKYREFQEQIATDSKSPTAKKGSRSSLKGSEKTVAPIKIRISARKKRKNDDSDDENPDSDNEFESLLKQHEKQLDEEEKEKAERKAAKVKSNKKGKKVKKKKDGEEDGYETDHQDYCEVCQQGGEIILCDTCPRAYHLVCLDPDMEEPPEGKWSCPHCESEGPPQKPREVKEKGASNMENCRVCKEEGDLLCCDACPSSYHAYCLNPALTEVPEGEWHCPRCMIEEPKNRPEKILSWRWIEIQYPDPAPEEEQKAKETENGEAAAEGEKKAEEPHHIALRPPRKMAPRHEREFLIKWKYMSYWHCEWVNEMVLDVHFAQQLRMYWRKMDPEVPPEIDDGSQEDLQTGKIEGKEKENDRHNLEEKFYRYGIKPEWLQVHRVINHVQYGKTQFDYLVKWRELVYEQATWERDDFDMPGYEEAILKYWTYRERTLGEAVPKHIAKKITAKKNEASEGEKEKEKEKDKKRKDKGKGDKATIDLRKKYEVQPDYISDTGGNLHDYQLEGINWLRHCWSNNTDAILADEMGLGKTIQTITFLYSLVKEGHSKGPFLVAAPLSTLINWERECEFWSPDFYVVTYVGDKESRAVIREHEFSFVEGAVKGGPKATRMRSDSVKFHVLLTSYELINIDKA
uniref:DNA helicase n=1 Tax=Plectus sambesii TaxID=2011161 RepID=A0A914XBA7_9BILA